MCGTGSESILLYFLELKSIEFLIPFMYETSIEMILIFIFFKELEPKIS
jgi:hypothetical protein